MLSVPLWGLQERGLGISVTPEEEEEGCGTQFRYTTSLCGRWAIELDLLGHQDALWKQTFWVKLKLRQVVADAHPVSPLHLYKEDEKNSYVLGAPPENSHCSEMGGCTEKCIVQTWNIANTWYGLVFLVDWSQLFTYCPMYNPIWKGDSDAF